MWYTTCVYTKYLVTALPTAVSTSHPFYCQLFEQHELPAAGYSPRVRDQPPGSSWTRRARHPCLTHHPRPSCCQHLPHLAPKQRYAHSARCWIESPPLAPRRRCAFFSTWKNKGCSRPRGLLFLLMPPGGKQCGRVPTPTLPLERGSPHPS